MKQFLVILLLLTSGTLRGEDRYVSSAGNDSYDGRALHYKGARVGPWRTIQHASTVARPGWTIHVAAGTYSITTAIRTTASGTPVSPIVFAGDHDKGARIWNTKLVSTDTAVWNQDGNYVTIRGFDMTSSNPAARFGIHSGGAHNTYSDNYIHDIWSDAPGAGIMIGGGGDYNVLDGNVVARIGHTVGGSTDNQGIYVQENHTMVINNILFGCRKICIQIWSGVTKGKPQYNVVSNNTVFGAFRGFAIGAANASFADYNIITNNIVYRNTDLGLYIANGYQGFVGTHNVIAFNNATDNGNADYYNIPHQKDIGGDPLFVDYRADGSGNYRLQDHSACRNAGTMAGSPLRDFLHVSRPQGAAPDCGAYEYIEESSSLKR